MPDIIKPDNHLPYPEAAQRRANFDRDNEAMIRQGLAVQAVFIGDSITADWPLHTFFSSSGKLVNRGIGGDTASGVYRRLAGDALQLRPACVVLKIGINDTWGLDDTPRTADKTSDAIRERIVSHVWASLALAGQHQQPLVLCSILPVNIPPHGPGNPTNDERNTMIQKINQRLRPCAARHGMVYADAHAALVGADGRTLRPELTEDGIHLNNEGYACLSAAVGPVLAAYGIEMLSDHNE